MTATLTVFLQTVMSLGGHGPVALPLWIRHWLQPYVGDVVMASLRRVETGQWWFVRKVEIKHDRTQ